MKVKLTDKDFEEILTINAQAKALTNVSYCNELENEIFNAMKNKTELSDEQLKHALNNYLALQLIGLNNCDTKTFKKLEKFYYGDTE